MAFALRRANPEDADDVVAETFLVAWRRLDDLPSDPLPWLLGIARKVIATNRRGDQRKGHLHGRLHDQASEVLLQHPSVERLETARAFNSLSEKDRETLMLIGWDGLTVTQAAEVVGCSTASFSVRLHRARRRLAQRIELDPSTPFLTHPTPNTEDAR